MATSFSESADRAKAFPEQRKKSAIKTAFIAFTATSTD